MAEIDKKMKLEPIDFLSKLFYFRLKNVNLLLNYNYLQKTYQIFPSLEIQDKEFNSFKFYILKNLSLIGEFIIENPNLFSYEKDFYPGIRYENSFCWQRFNFLGYYSGEIYKFILNYSNSCEKLVKIEDFEGLNDSKIEFNKILSTVRLSKNLSQKECVIFLYYHDLDFRDYSKRILQNILSKKEFFNLCLRKGKLFNTTIGLYKAFFIVLHNNIKGSITNKRLIQILNQIIKLEKNYSSDFKLDPYSWPWIFGEDIKNQIRDINVFREALGKIP